MITLNLKIGNTIVAGVSFSTANQVDTVDILVSNLNSLTSQLVHTILDNGDDQQVAFEQISENFAVGQTISILLTADSETDVNPFYGTYTGLKSVYVELLQ